MSKKKGRAPYKYNGVEYNEIGLFETNNKKPVNVWEPADKRVQFPSWSVLANIMSQKDVAQYVLGDDKGRKYLNVSYVDSNSILLNETEVIRKFYVLLPRGRFKATWLSPGDVITFNKGITSTISVLETKFLSKRKVGWVVLNFEQ